MFNYNMLVVKLKLFGPCMTFLHYFVKKEEPPLPNNVIPFKRK